MTLLAIIRYLAVVKPIRLYKISAGKNVVIMCCCNWILPLPLVLPQVLGWWGKFIFNHYDGTCLPLTKLSLGIDYIVMFIVRTLLIQVIPFTIILICYWRIYREFLRSQRRISNFNYANDFTDGESMMNGQDRLLNLRRRKEMKLAVTILIIILICQLSYFPMAIGTILDSFDPIIRPDITKKALIVISFSYISCIANPLIILFRNEHFRAILRRNIPAWMFRNSKAISTIVQVITIKK
ncbi:Rhodopsin, GQ-coupled [Trichoplax sp. H2]|nr:Rhodopsin, GQ-coupled [Trichoplax sp. H2]|eukprot:RDD38368.1 Rhodopsin, GQ-coupled [Trichoplax sp. H2]